MFAGQTYLRAHADGVAAMARPAVSTGLASRASRPRRLLHVLAGVLGWIGFAALAVWQLGFFVPPKAGDGLAALAACGAALTCAGIGWVRWNQAIYRRRHRRTSPIVMNVDFSHDSLGRPIAAPPGACEAQGQIFVAVDAATGVKSYRRQRTPIAAQERPRRVA